MLRLWRRLWSVVHRRRWEAELEEELAFHRDMKERELASQGSCSKDAAAMARREMGNLTLMREEARYALVPVWLDSIRRDLIYAVRSLAAHSSFLLLAVPMLAIGLGVNVSFMTVFNALALRPWPVAQPDRLIRIDQAAWQGENGRFYGLPLAAREFLATNSKTLAQVMAVRDGYEPLEGDLSGKFVRIHYVSGNFFDALGVRLLDGRGFLPEEDRTGAPAAVAVLSHAVWQSRYGADPEIVGKTIRVSEVPAIVVGVVAEEFQGLDPGTPAVYMPMASLALVRPHDVWATNFLTDSRDCCAAFYARLAPGVTREEANAELDVLIPAFRATEKLPPIREGQRPARVRGLRLIDDPNPRRQIGQFFTLMFVGFTLTTLLACITVGNLLLARASAREPEIATRLALGASRGRVIRQLLTESLLLAVVGGGGALAFAAWLPGWAIPLLTDGEASAVYLPIDAAILGYTLVLALISCVIFGLAPALHGTKTSLYSAANIGARAGVRSLRFRNGVLALQVALSVVLLTAASLTLRGVSEAARRGPGFRIDDVTAVTLALPASARGPKQIENTAARLETLLADLPADGRWARARHAPLSSSISFSDLSIPGRPAGEKLRANVLPVSAGYFEILEIPVLEGRAFFEEDIARDVVVINQSMALKLWPEGNPVGRTFLTGSRTREVVGVVKDAELVGLGYVAPMFFEPVGATWAATVLVRSLDEPFLARLRGVARDLDPGAQLRIDPLRTNLERELAPLRAGSKIAGTLGVFALLLASVGMVGVVGYLVQRRTREIGVRIALGAKPGQIARLVAWTGGKAVFAGGALGLMGALAASRLLEGRLFGLSALDAPAYLLAMAVLVAATVLAGFVPVRRATRIQPAVALRHE
jgi:predicted permease